MKDYKKDADWVKKQVWENDNFKTLDDESQEFIKSCLMTQEEGRLSAEKLMELDFITSVGKDMIRDFGREFSAKDGETDVYQNILPDKE